MTENIEAIPFNVWVNFDNPIFFELDSKIRPLLAKKTSNLSRELQIRTLLYTNFNNYLTLLLTKTDENIANLEKITDVPEADRLTLVTSIIGLPLKKIMSGFINLFNRVD